MSTLALRQDILAETYEDLKRMVYQLVHKFAFKYDVPFDDLIGKAHVLFVKAVDSYDARKGAKVSSWVYSKVGWGLISHLRREKRHRNHVNFDDLPTDMFHGQADNFLLEIQSEISTDAKTILDILLEARHDFTQLCRWNRAKSREGVQRTIKEYLDDLGWHRRKIERAMHELRALINDTSEPYFVENEEEDFFEEQQKVPSTARAELFLLSRIGLTPAQVRSYCSNDYRT